MTNSYSKGRIWTAGILKGLVIVFMLFDSIMKFIKPASVVEGTLTLGYAEHHIMVIGALGLLSTLLYAIPRTAVLGAVLLTAYFGGAIATNLRVDAPLFTHVLFPVYFAIFTWGGIWLRNNRIRNLIPFKWEE
ncbi:DoxX family protein [Brevibacillus sp. AY1]|uniref:DoxX family protein n=1 Tax=Brevibacillus sp. AY1 TaxID=2807621 RepID=UPI002453F4F5|nr:DoxX family protein [Brevibacillus sp. AY1]MDH4619190.1 DoxX family protein [Brevibacillus sp. AY1]